MARLSRSACSVRSVTPRSLASARAFASAFGEKSNASDVEALFGEENAVAALAVGDGKRLLAAA